MPSKQERPKLPLKNKSEMDAQRAYIFWKRLEHAGPDQLKALAALAAGDEALVKMRMRAELMTRYPYWFNDDGVLQPDAKNVIRSAVLDSDDGQVVVTPFLLATPREVKLLTGIHRRLTRLEAGILQQTADELEAQEHLSSVLRELRRSSPPLSKEAKDSDDPGHSRGQ